MSIADKIRVALAPAYLVVGVTIFVRGIREPLGWILGLSFAAYGVYRIALVEKSVAQMTSTMTLHPIGIAIAATFAVSIFSLLWWMLHPPEQIQAAVAKAMRGVSAVMKILVPVRGSSYNERAVELACRLGAAQKAEIVAAHIIEVPLALPLSTPLPPEEKQAEEVLLRAKEIIEHHGMTAQTITRRDRDAARGILHVAQELDCDMVILGINPKNLAAGESVGKATEQLLRKSHIEVIVDMHPEVPEDN